MGLLGEGECEETGWPCCREASSPSAYIFIKSTQVRHSSAGIFEVPVPV